MGIRELRESFGLTQHEVARAAGMHQPDLSRLERDPAIRPDVNRRVRAAIRTLVRPSVLLEQHRDELRQILLREGVRNPRIFGSVRHGTDKPGSDIDIVAELPASTGLLGLIEIIDAAESVIGVPVDLVPDDPRTEGALATAKAEAVPL